MNIKKYRAKTMQEALALVRRELGPQASVLRTREVRGGGILPWIAGSRVIEVLASDSVSVPSRLPPKPRPIDDEPAIIPRRVQSPPEPQLEAAMGPYQDQLATLQTRIEQLHRRAPAPASGEMPELLYRLFTDLIEAEVSEEQAREWVDRLRRESSPPECATLIQLKSRLAGWIEDDITVAGSIQITPGRRRLVALVGPTGVGKTTTIAKLAANFRLREKRSVGLITVDTYRIAAVEQLRTYADIIDLPMEIVATPREMHQALARMANVDLILMDTAGRSPRDEVKIQELKSMLNQASPDEVHLVLSCAASGGTLAKTAAQFAGVGTTSLVLTKLDEATSLGNLVTLARSCRLPLSYVTHGQNVPDDIAPANAQKLARVILGMQDATAHVHPY